MYFRILDEFTSGSCTLTARLNSRCWKDVWGQRRAHGPVKEKNLSVKKWPVKEKKGR